MADAQTFLTLQKDMKQAMRDRDAQKLGTLRMLISALKNKKIDLRRDLTEDDILTTLSTEAKRRREASEAFRKGDRPALADAEDFELTVIAEYLPKPLTEDEVYALIATVKAETGAETKRDMGKVMGVLKGKYTGQMDFGKAGAAVKEMLA